MDFALRVIFGGGAVELWCWGPPIIPVGDSDLYFSFSAKDNRAHDRSRKWGLYGMAELGLFTLEDAQESLFSPTPRKDVAVRRQVLEMALS